MPVRLRRTYLVDRDFQLKLIFRLVGWGVLLTVLFGLWIWQTHEQQAAEAVARGVEAAADASGRGRQLLWALVGIGLLCAIALGLVGFILSHRVAGPLHVMGHQLRALAAGRFPRRRSLRRSDDLKVFFSEFLDTVDSLRDREVRHTAMLEEVLERMRAAAPRAPELIPAVEALADEVRARRDALSEALTPPPTAARGVPSVTPAPGGRITRH